MAHPSGLHAYLSNVWNEEPDYVQCVGPFSSYKDKLSTDDVKNHIADAIEAIESMSELQGRFTYWGSLCRLSEPTNTVAIMGHEFGLIPNPCFRSDILMATGRTSEDPSLLHREWVQHDNDTRIQHKLGSCFYFPMNERTRLCIGGHVENIAEDIKWLEPAIASFTLKSLGGLAFAVLAELAGDFPASRLKRLRLRYSDRVPL